jgi:hypothetical protein
VLHLLEIFSLLFQVFGADLVDYVTTIFKKTESILHKYVISQVGGGSQGMRRAPLGIRPAARARAVRTLTRTRTRTISLTRTRVTN